MVIDFVLLPLVSQRIHEVDAGGTITWHDLLTPLVEEHERRLNSAGRLCENRHRTCGGCCGESDVAPAVFLVVLLQLGTSVEDLSNKWMILFSVVRERKKRSSFHRHLNR